MSGTLGHDLCGISGLGFRVQDLVSCLGLGALGRGYGLHAACIFSHGLVFGVMRCEGRVGFGFDFDHDFGFGFGSRLRFM